MARTDHIVAPEDLANVFISLFAVAAVFAALGWIASL